MVTLDSKKVYVILGSILSVSFILRFYGIWNAEHGDEINEIFEALRVCSGHFNYNRWFKRFYLYILSFEFGIYYLIGHLFGFFGTPIQFAKEIVTNMKPLFIIARITNVIFGTFSAFLVYLIGKRMSSAAVGLLASLIFSFSVLHVASSHYATVDISMLMLLLLAMVCILNIMELGVSVKHYFLFAIFAGLAIQAKIPAIIVVFPFLAAHLLNVFYLKKDEIKLISLHILFAGIGLVIGLILGNPAVLFRPDAFIKAALGIGTGFTKQSTVYDFVPSGWDMYWKVILKDLGIATSILALCGIILTITKRDIRYSLILAFIIPFYIIMASSKKLVFARYMIPVIPFLCLFAAHFLLFALGKTKILKKKLIFATLVGLVLIYPVYRALKFDISLMGLNTRYLAGKWFEENIPAGSKVLLESGKSINSRGIFISESPQNILDKMSRVEQSLAQGQKHYDHVGIVDRNALIFYKLQLETLPELTYDITSTEFNRNIKPYSYYIANGYEYAAINSDTQDFYLSDYARNLQPTLYNFYEDLMNRGELIKSFEPNFFHRGPRFRIFRFR